MYFTTESKHAVKLEGSDADQTPYNTSYIRTKRQRFVRVKLI